MDLKAYLSFTSEINDTDTILYMWTEQNRIRRYDAWAGNRMGYVQLQNKAWNAIMDGEVKVEVSKVD